jgi:hypothetical protein
MERNKKSEEFQVHFFTCLQGRPYGRQGRDMSPLENVKNLGKLFAMFRIYLFKNLI